MKKAVGRNGFSNLEGWLLVLPTLRARTIPLFVMLARRNSSSLKRSYKSSILKLNSTT